MSKQPLIPLIQKAWSFVKGSGASKLVATEADVTEMFRSGSDSSKLPKLDETTGPSADFVKLISQVSKTSSIEEATNIFNSNSKLVQETLDKVDLGKDGQKQQLQSILASLQVADDPTKTSGLENLGADDRWKDDHGAGFGKSIDWEKFKQFTDFPAVVDEAQHLSQHAHKVLSEISGSVESPKSFETNYDAYLEAEHQRLNKTCSEVLDVIGEAEQHVKQLQEFGELLPELRMDTLVEANPELQQMLEDNFRQSNWFIDEYDVNYDDNAAEQELKGRNAAWERFEKQLGQNTDQFAEAIGTHQTPAEPLTQYNFIDVLNTTSDSWQQAE